MFQRFLKFTAVLLTAVGIFGSTLSVEAYVSVKGYYRSNGTYVQPYVRSNPNGVKYDNYGYKPSQGLYNDSYGTKGATWDTPTYITDPSYYTGKNIYDSLHGDSSFTAPVTPTCPANSSYDSANSNCKCNLGYIISGSNCVSASMYCSNTYGSGSDYDSLLGSCKCRLGYRWNDGQTKCVDSATYCPANASLTGGSCYCNTGFQLNSTKDGCVVKMTCIEGYVNRNGSCVTYTQDCLDTFGSYVVGSKLTDYTSSCSCITGYTWNDNRTACVQETKTQIFAPVFVSVAPIVADNPPIKYIRTTTKVLARESPFVGGKVIGVTGNGFAYRFLDQRTDWLKIDFNGKDAWIMQKYTKAF